MWMDVNFLTSYIKLQAAESMSSYDFKCLSGEHYQSFSLQIGCLNETYGENCTMTCTCPENAFKNCDQDTGKCKCLPGWYGTNCTEGK